MSNMGNGAVQMVGPLGSDNHGLPNNNSNVSTKAFTGQNGADFEDLSDEVQRLFTTMQLFSHVIGVSDVDFFIPRPSRHVVVVGQSMKGTYFGKSYKGHEQYNTEQRNLSLLSDINELRRPLYRSVTGSDADYIGLPYFDTSFDATRLFRENESRNPLVLFSPVPGELLYDRMLDNRARFKEIIAAAVQIARIQQVGKIQREKLQLQDVVRDREDRQPTTHYFMERFKDVFLNQLEQYSDLSISQEDQREMNHYWQILVAQNLANAQLNGHSGMYYDGNPTHHVIMPIIGSVVSLDFEYRIITPELFGLASLLSFGLTREEGQPYLSQKQQSNILDRFLLEKEFVKAMEEEAEERASRIFNYVKGRSHRYNLAGGDSDEFFRFLGGYNDVGKGKKYRNDIHLEWQYALLDRNAAWIGHKARQRAVAEQLGKEGIRFMMQNPQQQYAAEQRQHLAVMLEVLGRLKDMPRNGNVQHQFSAERLHFLFSRLYDIGKTYFNPSKS